MQTNSKLRPIGQLVLLALALACLPACVAEVGGRADRDVASIEQAIVFGDDDRLDYGEFGANTPERKMADATALLLNGGVQCSGGTCQIDLTYDMPGEDAGLCQSEPFSFQPVSATSFCSAVLVGPRLFATAGHCISPIMQTNCINMRVLFGYDADQQEGFPSLTYPESDVYTCTRVVISPDLSDYALIEVNRPVSGRVPAWIRRGGEPAVGASVTEVSYPSGLPLKIDQGGQIRSVTSTSIHANVDVSEISSGSPLFDTATGVVEGVMDTSPAPTFDIANPGTPNECLLWNSCADVGCFAGYAAATRTSTFASQVPLHPAGIVIVAL